MLNILLNLLRIRAKGITKWLNHITGNHLFDTPQTLFRQGINSLENNPSPFRFALCIFSVGSDILTRITRATAFSKGRCFLKKVQQGLATTLDGIQGKGFQRVDTLQHVGLEFSLQIAYIKVRLVLVKVSVGNKHETFGRQSVSSGASNLLVVLFHRLGRTVVYHASCIGLVNL